MNIPAGENEGCRPKSEIFGAAVQQRFISYRVEAVQKANSNQT